MDALKLAGGMGMGMGMDMVSGALASARETASASIERVGSDISSSVDSMKKVTIPNQCKA